MSNYELLKTAIDAVIKANGRAEITGSIMNQTLTAMVNSLGRGYQFIGVATPEINPNTPDEKVFYLAMQAGTYTNFGNITLNTGLTVLTWDGDWHSLTVFRTDTTPTLNSADLITSGAVYNAIKNDGGAYDVSAHFQTGGEGGGNTYTLANAITKVPVNMRKGGMSIKFVDATTNKYVKHTFLNPTTDGFTNVNNWQGIIESAAGFHTIGSAKNHQLASVGALVEEFGVKCVNELPTASASTMNKIYSIPTTHPVAGKRRDEYFTVETGIAPDYTDVKDLVTVTAIPDNALGAQVGEGKFIANDTTNNKAYYFVSVHAENEWGYEVTVEEVASGKVARMRDESQYASNGTAWVADYHYADYTWESLSPDLSIPSAGVVSLGYGVCTTGTYDSAKTVNIPHFMLLENGTINVLFTTPINTENTTLNVSLTGAKPIRILGQNLPAGVIKAETYVTMAYDGTAWNIVNLFCPDAQFDPAALVVDMGLPSGVKWASRDIDLTKPGGFCETPFTYEKSFFSWGNIDGHNPISVSAFDYGWGGVNEQEPYYEGQPYGSTPGNTLTGNIAVGEDFDAARANLGAPWRMPTTGEFDELFANIRYINADGTPIDSSQTNKFVTVNGVVGLYLESTINGARLFFSCSGFGSGRSWLSRGSGGHYWSSSWLSARSARYLVFYSGGVYPQNGSYRCGGFAVRPVQ